MATLADSLVSSSSRSLTLRMRPDLSARRVRYHGQTYWVVKEPIGLNYFRFHEEEYAILCMMDGTSSLESIKERFEAEFTPQKITFPGSSAVRRHVASQRPGCRRMRSARDVSYANGAMRRSVVS